MWFIWFIWFDVMWQWDIFYGHGHGFDTCWGRIYRPPQNNLHTLSKCEGFFWCLSFLSLSLLFCLLSIPRVQGRPGFCSIFRLAILGEYLHGWTSSQEVWGQFRVGLRVISFTSRGGLGEFRNSSKQNQNYLERFWPSLPTGGVQDGKLKPSEKLSELLVKLGIENGGNYSPQLGPWTKSLLNSRQLQKLDVEYERLIVPQLF